MKYDIESLKEKLKNRLGPKHYGHSLRTAETAARMALAFGVDEEKAYLAGLLHDYAKSMSDEELIDQSKKLGIEANSVELAFPYLLHAEISARLVELDLGVEDKEIVTSIKNHTVGATSMTQLDKIIYVADMIEPGRPYPGLDSLRRMALDDLDEVFRGAYVHSLEHLVRSRKLIHPATVEVWNKLISQQNG